MPVVIAVVASPVRAVVRAPIAALDRPGSNAVTPNRIRLSRPGNRYWSRSIRAESAVLPSQKVGSVILLFGISAPPHGFVLEHRGALAVQRSDHPQTARPDRRDQAHMAQRSQRRRD